LGHYLLVADLIVGKPATDGGNVLIIRSCSRSCQQATKIDAREAPLVISKIANMGDEVKEEVEVKAEKEDVSLTVMQTPEFQAPEW
jgi:hypothetical protein